MTRLFFDLFRKNATMENNVPLWRLILLVDNGSNALDLDADVERQSGDFDAGPRRLVWSKALPKT
mgnify:CR=1 FL=1